MKIQKIDQITTALAELSDNELSELKFTMPWQMSSPEEEGRKDSDGFSTGNPDVTEDRAALQASCWEKFNKSPFVGTAIRGQAGRLTGLGFEITSEIQEIQEAIQDVERDPRNRLYANWTKYVGRSIIEGELFLMLTVHTDGFIEVDFIDPSHIMGGGVDGVLYHPMKTTFPLFYFINMTDPNINAGAKTILVPSIYIAYFPELIKTAKKVNGYDETKTKDAKSSKNSFNDLGGFQRFIVSWDKSFVTRRNISYLRTVVEWLNYYENLKKYEIDHKKSAGAYLWVISIDDPKAFRTWLGLTDEERRKTGIMAKKTPGSTLVLPPGMTIEAINPKLPSISETDTDILHMVTGGLNEPEDVSTGQSKGTFASVKASRGPMSDRISDEIAYFERFLRYDFFRAVFFLMSKVSSFPETFKTRTAVDFKNKKPVFKDLDVEPEQLIDITFPTSEVNDAETRARAYLGVKHGSVYDVLGMPNKEIARKIGFGNYRRLRLEQATEEDRFPELKPPVDAAGEQLDQEGETKKKPKVGPDGKPIPAAPAVPAKPGAPAKPAVTIPPRKPIVKPVKK